MKVYTLCVRDQSKDMPAPAERAPLMGGAPSRAAGARAYGDTARGMRVLKDNLRVMPTSVAGAWPTDNTGASWERRRWVFKLGGFIV